MLEGTVEDTSDIGHLAIDSPRRCRDAGVILTGLADLHVNSRGEPSVDATTHLEVVRSVVVEVAILMSNESVLTIVRKERLSDETMHIEEHLPPPNSSRHTTPTLMPSVSENIPSVDVSNPAMRACLERRNAENIPPDFGGDHFVNLLTM